MPHSSLSRRRRGFTLVEMAIVLAIIGLIVGGIMAGQEVYYASQLQSIATDVSKIKSGVDAFKLKYQAIPGDMPDATRYWGSYAGSCTAPVGCDDIDTCQSIATCNGNGDGVIAVNPVGTTTIAHYIESLRAWQHLSNAQMIQGTYSGLPGTMGYTGGGAFGDHRVGVNVPASKINKLGYSMYYLGRWASGQQPWLFEGEYGNVLVIGGEQAGYETARVALTPSESWSLDTKMDDGLPGKGRLRARAYNASSWASTCVMFDSTQGAIAEYNVADKEKTCFLYYTRIAE